MTGQHRQYKPWWVRLQDWTDTKLNYVIACLVGGDVWPPKGGDQS